MRLWTWRGTWFGYREGRELWTHDGRHVGRFVDDMVYGPSGRYLGEVRHGRLLSRRASRALRGETFAAQPPRVAAVGHVDLVALPLLAGYEDFPAAQALRRALRTDDHGIAGEVRGPDAR